MQVFERLRDGNLHPVLWPQNKVAAVPLVLASKAEAERFIEAHLSDEGVYHILPYR